MKDVADVLATLNELGRPDLAETIHFLMGERDGLMKALASAKTVIESKDKAYSLIQQRWDARLGNRLHVWDYDNPEDGSWDNIEEYLHDTTPNAGETVRLNLAMPLQDVEVEMLEVGKSGEPIRWVVRDAKTGAMLAAKANGGS